LNWSGSSGGIRGLTHPYSRDFPKWGWGLAHF
jgi:hypothetical protein